MTEWAVVLTVPKSIRIKTDDLAAVRHNPHAIAVDTCCGTKPDFSQVMLRIHSGKFLARVLPQE
jgi:hypothetical protein